MIVLHHAGTLAGNHRIAFGHEIVEILDVGVPIFFITSGFLIYRPLVAARFAGRSQERLASFWWKRLLRVVPAYWVALSFFWAIGSFELGDAWWRYYVFIQPYDRNTVVGGLVQAWTLAAEVAFYFLVPLWSLLLASLIRRIADQRRRLAVELLALGSLWALAIVARWAIGRLWPMQAGASFTWLITNLDTFAWGMALATLSVYLGQDSRLRATLDRLAGRLWLWWTAAAAVVVFYSYRIGARWEYSHLFWQRRQLIYLAVGLLVVIPVVFGADRRSWGRRHWSDSPIPWLATVSYGLYLWHFDWMKRAVRSYDWFHQVERWPGWLNTPLGDSNFLVVLAIGLVTGLIGAALSWYLLEQPISRFRNLVGSGSSGPAAKGPAATGPDPGTGGGAGGTGETESTRTVR